MKNLDEDAMICDFAQYYGLYHLREHQPSLIATLAAGLPDNSRSKMRVSGMMLTFEQLLLAKILDDLELILWSRTEDAIKGRNRPKSILSEIYHDKDKNEEIRAYDSPEAFEAEYRRLVGEINGN